MKLKNFDAHEAHKDSSNSTRSMNLMDGVRLIALAAIWGSSFIFLRILAPVLGPLATADYRLFIASGALFIYSSLLGIDLMWRAHWRHYLIVGLINSALPFGLYSFAALHLPACYSAVLNATAPFFGIFFSALWLGQSITRQKIMGLLLGAAGVAFFGCVGTVSMSFKLGIAGAACLMAALCLSLGGIYIKKFASHVKPVALATGSLLMAALVLFPFMLCCPPTGVITPCVVASLLAIALLCSSIAFLLYFRLIADIGPAKALTVVFLIPAFGILWSVLFLGETVTAPMLAGCVLIISGTCLVVRS